MYNTWLLPIDKFIKNHKIDALKRLAIFTVRDLLFHLPYDYKYISLNPDLSSLTHGQEITVKVRILEILQSVGKRQPLKICVSNDSGLITLIFFNKPHPFLFRMLQVGKQITIAGKVEIFDYRPQISHPQIIFDNKLSQSTFAVIPIYHLTYGLTNTEIHNYIKSAYSYVEKEIDVIPVEFLVEYNLCSLITALNVIHIINEKILFSFDAKVESHDREERICRFKIGYKLEAKIDRATQRLKFDELMSYHFSIKNLRDTRNKHCAERYGASHNIERIKNEICDSLGYHLTEGQRAALDDIENDFASGVQMFRLLQGDVGCGKTLVALLSSISAIESGKQVALMAPTDILAQQHYIFFQNVLKRYGYNVELLTGSIQGSRRNNLLQKLQNDLSINVVVGTHALFQEKIRFYKLGYVIIDEQHRFGVKQRSDLLSKAENPHLLVMSATPIPRSLTIALFGDMDVSRINVMPVGRLPIITSVMKYNKIDELIIAIGRSIQHDDRVYWICPLVENEDLDGEVEVTHTLASVTERFASLHSVYGDTVCLVHGKMLAKDKDAAMLQFKSGETKIIVATTVIEVGVNVPEATTIIIENAERFGLAQLHQLRGRVGRGNKQSYCILIYGSRTTKICLERLKIIRNSSDGFYIAEKDLELRGYGEILGTKQSGVNSFRFVDLIVDNALIVQTSNIVRLPLYISYEQFITRLYNNDESSVLI